MQSARSPGAKHHPPHVGGAVQVGPYEVLATGTQYECEPGFGDVFDNPDVVIVALSSQFPGVFRRSYRVIWAELKDYGGVPSEWGDFLREQIVPLLEGGQTLLAYCVGSHGRTGTFLASLIALLESSDETPDPIAAVRERHCEKAVETLAQAEAIFALRGQAVPIRYVKEFRARIVSKLSHTAVVMATQTNKKGTT